MAIESAEDRLLTVAEVAEQLRLHPITVRRHIKAERLRAVRVGRAVRVRQSDVDKFARPDERAQLPRRWAVTPEEELERRRVAVDKILAFRDSLPPLGITTTQLVRQSRRELERRYERWTKRRR